MSKSYIGDSNSTDFVIKDDCSYNSRSPIEKLNEVNKMIYSGSQNSIQKKQSNTNTCIKLKDIKLEDSKWKNSVSRIITERDSKIEHSNRESQRSQMNKSPETKTRDSPLKKSPFKTPNKISSREYGGRIISSESKNSITRAVNESRPSGKKLEEMKSEKELFKQSLYRTKTPKLMKDSQRKSVSNNKKENIQQKLQNDSFKKYKFLFEDVEKKKSTSVQNSSLRSSFQRNKGGSNLFSEEGDLSNFNRFCSQNKTQNSIIKENLSRVEEQADKKKLHTEKRIEKTFTYKKF